MVYKGALLKLSFIETFSSARYLTLYMSKNTKKWNFWACQHQLIRSNRERPSRTKIKMILEKKDKVKGCYVIFQSRCEKIAQKAIYFYAHPRKLGNWHLQRYLLHHWPDQTSALWWGSGITSSSLLKKSSFSPEVLKEEGLFCKVANSFFLASIPQSFYVKK